MVALRGLEVADEQAYVPYLFLLAPRVKPQAGMAQFAGQKVDLPRPRRC